MSSPGLIDVIVLAGGLGTRLRPLVEEVPKCLAPVAGRPFLDIILAQLVAAGCVNAVVLAVGYKSEVIVERYRNSGRYPFPVDFSVETAPLGTGGAIVQALPLTSTSNVLVMNGDTFVELDIPMFEKAHVASEAPVTLAVVTVPDATRYGTVEVEATTGRIARFVEKTTTARAGLVNAGCYLMRRTCLEAMPRGKMLSLEGEILPGLIEKGIYSYYVAGKFIDIGTPESYLAAQSYLA
jgi:NDP-sugar pyrophosphorylase family protein